VAADGVELATAWVRLVPTVEGITDQVTKAVSGSDMEKAGRASGRKWSAGAKVAMTVGAAAVSAGIVKVFTTGMEELKFGEKISAQTDILVQNTGFAMKTAEIEDYTLALSQLSGVSEEDLQAAGNSILKFGDVSEENYKKAVASVNDLAASGKNASSVAEGLGKALSDPATAAGKLRRMGIALTEDQQKMIDTMTEAGDVAGAQGVILDALEGTYGGMAEAAGGTLEGNLNKLNNTWENLAGSAVESLMPAIQGVVGGLQGFVNWISENQAIMPILIGALGFLAVAFVGVTVATWAMNTALLANPITWIILGILALVAALVVLVMNWDQVVAWVTDVWSGFISWITGVIGGFVSWWNGMWTGFAGWITDIWNRFVGWIRVLWVGFIVWLISAGLRITSWWNGLWTGIGRFVSDVWNNYIVNPIRTALNWISNTISTVLGTVGKTWNNMWQGMVDFLGNVFAGVVGIVKAPINGIIGLVNGAINAINGISVTIPDWVPVVGGQTWGLSLPRIPMLADGGTITRAGAVIVGERGPEILRLPAGASVDPDIAGADGGSPAGVVIQGDVYTRDDRELVRYLDRQARRSYYQAGALRKVG
jgi:hypothetical protein